MSGMVDAEMWSEFSMKLTRILLSTLSTQSFFLLTSVFR